MIFNTLFDNIYVLNLKESIDRKNHIETEFNRVGITKYELFEATPHDSEEVVNITKSNLVKKFPNCFRCHKKRCACENNFLTSFQIGNWCSFLNIFNDIIKKNYNFVLICEDDIVFSFQHKRIIDRLLSKESFKYYNIDMKKPLLIRMGTAFNPDNHNSNASPQFIKNFSLCNPCFAINRQMAQVYLYFLKIIDYHSDVYFHQKIPKRIPGVQYFTMYPYPIYELSFVKEKQKFSSTVRPKNEYRRIEYKEFLFLSSNLLLNICIKSITKKMNLDIPIEKVGYNGNINYFILLTNKEQKQFYFENKILLIDNFYDDIKIIYQNIIKNTEIYKIYKIYLLKINEKFNLELDLENINKLDQVDQVDQVDQNILINKIINFYKYYLQLIELENIIKVDINNENDYSKISKYIDINTLKKNINIYNNYKNIFLTDIKITNLEIDSLQKI